MFFKVEKRLALLVSIVYFSQASHWVLENKHYYTSSDLLIEADCEFYDIAEFNFNQRFIFNPGLKRSNRLEIVRRDMFPKQKIKTQFLYENGKKLSQVWHFPSTDLGTLRRELSKWQKLTSHFFG